MFSLNFFNNVDFAFSLIYFLVSNGEGLCNL